MKLGHRLVVITKIIESYQCLDVVTDFFFFSLFKVSRVIY